jgi:hypothetical protein
MAYKVCSACKRKRKLKHFNYSNRKAGRLQAYCRPCQNKQSRQHYRDNPEQYKARNRAAKKRNRLVMKAHFQSHPCVDCGMSDIRVLDFDHRRNKKFNVCEQAHNGIAVKRLKEEIDKCDVRCRNCHAIRHEEERPGWRST